VTAAPLARGSPGDLFTRLSSNQKGRLRAAEREGSIMGKGSNLVVFAGLGLAALMMTDAGAGWAGIPMDPAHNKGTCILTQSSDTAPVVLAGRGGGRGGQGSGTGSDSTGWGGGGNSGSGQGYGLKDGSGSAPRPQDGTGYGAGPGAGSGNCDGTGPKGKGRGKRNN